MEPSFLEERLKEALTECARLQEENRDLRSKLGIELSQPIPALPSADSTPSDIVTNLSPVEKKFPFSKAISAAGKMFMPSVGRAARGSPAIHLPVYTKYRKLLHEEDDAPLGKMLGSVQTTENCSLV